MIDAVRPAIEVDGLRHRYGDREALSGVSFEVAPGELFALVGPNGGGKTTLLGIVSTLIRNPTGGTAYIDGVDVRIDPNGARSKIGVVFQRPSLDEHLTVAENLHHQGHLYGMRGARLRRQVAEVLERAGVADRASERAATLSGGLKRRVELAKGLLHKPVVLLLDEPTVGLDPGGRREFWRYLRELRERDGVAVLATTHLMEEAERCARVAILDRGRAVAIGAPDALRAEIRGDVITLEADQPDALAARIAEAFGVSPKIVDGAIRIERDDGPAFVPRLAEAFPGEIRSITVGKPTLEDVFVDRTGRPFMEDDDA